MTEPTSLLGSDDAVAPWWGAYPVDPTTPCLAWRLGPLVLAA